MLGFARDSLMFYYIHLRCRYAGLPTNVARINGAKLSIIIKKLLNGYNGVLPKKFDNRKYAHRKMFKHAVGVVQTCDKYIKAWLY